MGDLGDLCEQLEAHFNERAYEEALALADRILALEPESELGAQCKCACLIQLSRADDALALIERSGDALGGAAGVLPHAFCLYQKGDSAGALALLAPAIAAAPGAQALPLLHLQAQVQYKRGAYGDAAASYRRVLSDFPESAADEEVRTNAAAAFVMAGAHADAQRLTASLASGASLYELVYNCACAQIAVGAYAQAEALLDEALALSTRALEADELADEDEIAAEQAAIRVQRAYVAHKTGRDGEAADGYLGVLRIKGHEAVDTTVAAVAANNLVALRGDRDMFDSAKRCKAALADAVAAKLLPSQRLSFMTNHAILSWQMGKPQACRELLDGIEAEFGEADVAVLIRAALLYRPKPTSKEAPSAEAEALLSRWAAAHPDAAARPLLALAQLQARAPAATGGGGKGGGGASEPLRRAASTLAAIPSLRLAPRLVATAAAILESLGEAEAAAHFLNESLDLLGRGRARLLGAGEEGDEGSDGSRRAQLAPDALTRPHLAILRGAADFFERHGLWRPLAAVQAQLLAADPRDLVARSRMIVAASHFDPALAAEHDALLPDVAPADSADDDLAVDIDALENLGQLGGAIKGYTPPPATPAAAGKQAAAASSATVGGKRAADPPMDGALATQKRRKKRKPVLPKGFDPANPGPAPDPERWLPRKERSSYRRTKRDKKNAQQMRGPQGGPSSNSAALDISGKASSGGAGPSAAPTPPPAAGRKKKAGGKKGGAHW